MNRILMFTLVGVAALTGSTARPVVAAVMVFSQNFESGLSANESTAGLFVINTTGYGGNGTNHMMGHASGYTNSETSYYQILNLDLRNLTDIQMTFTYAGQLEQGFDFFRVLTSSTADFASPAPLNPLATSDMKYVSFFGYDSSTAAGGSSGTARFSLAAFSGSVVSLRFQFQSDVSVTRAGFNMDDLQITGNAMAVPEPGSLGLVVIGGGFAGIVGVFRRSVRRQ